MTSKLTIKQDAFVKAYLLNGGNATQAAIKAGYSEKTAQAIGAENLTKPVIQNAIKAHQQQAHNEFIWSKTKKLVALQSIIETAMTEHQEKGMLNASAAIAAIKAHNEMQGDNAPIDSTSTIKVSSTLAGRLTAGSKR
ncbi:terminase small subunit [Pseudoalteromonas sp. 2CM41L]|uniref:terminase small subunit n=1 Tax=Pseudoalteromonas sp. 2CM41L TaxID=2929857 RepID=UPI00200A3C6A|nr:terminase small subunit [Pseudoalteromonas sp. 2CM41L]MCK8106920.1 terminase small subunit [Pseudoalteromonas sp. 2CM41L]